MNYPTQTDNVKESTTYNGWTNYETWNVSLYINNDYDLYKAACSYVEFQEEVGQPVRYTGFLKNFSHMLGDYTPDGVSWNSLQLNTVELDEMLRELTD